MPRAPKAEANVLAELRARHLHCVTWNDIKAGIRRGDWEDGNYARHAHKVGPSCSNPFDKVCAAPSISTASVLEQLNSEKQQDDIAG